MGRAFRWLVTSLWTSNLGDGIGLAAGPLLIASLTRDPLVVALAALLQRLPWLLFGLWAGVLADRLERRRLINGVDLGRAGVLALLSATILTGTVGVVVVLVAMLLIGTAEVFADTASQTLLPMVVPREDLSVGNARLMAVLLTTNQLAGPAVGAALFAAGVATAVHHVGRLGGRRRAARDSRARAGDRAPRRSIAPASRPSRGPRLHVASLRGTDARADHRGLQHH